MMQESEPAIAAEQAVIVAVVGSLASVRASAWDALVPEHYPFLRHTFLLGLEQSGCAVAETGWQPLHVLLLGPPGSAEPQTEASQEPDLAGRALLAAVPLYVRGDSWGEFVFDFGWADLARRLGKQWYPKLLSAVPFTPATGPKLLIGPAVDQQMAMRHLLQALTSLQEGNDIQSVQLLFLPQAQAEAVAEQGWLHRYSLQALWLNPGYADMEAFLATLRHDARKNIRRERRRAHELGLELLVLRGTEMDDAAWAAAHRFYLAGVDKHHAAPYLNEGFFNWLQKEMPQSVLCSFARKDGRYVAGTFNYVSDKHLYGRYWGAEGEWPYLHFELCFYALMEWSIKYGIERFEPGAGTGHKFGRGLQPTLVHSAYRLLDPQLGAILGRHVAAEREQTLGQLAYVREHGTLRRDVVEPGPEP